MAELVVHAHTPVISRPTCTLLQSLTIGVLLPRAEGDNNKRSIGNPCPSPGDSNANKGPRPPLRWTQQQYQHRIGLNPRVCGKRGVKGRELRDYSSRPGRNLGLLTRSRRNHLSSNLHTFAYIERERLLRRQVATTHSLRHTRRHEVVPALGSSANCQDV